MAFTSTRKFSFTACLLAMLAMLGVACDWNQFGNGPTNPHNSSYPGPVAGIGMQQNLTHPMGGVNHNFEAGVTSDKHGSMYVTSFDRFVSAYSPIGMLAGSYDLGLPGPRAIPYVASNIRDRKRAMIFTGAEGGGFHAINVAKTSFFAYTLTLADADMTFGPSESSPKRALDETLYIVDKKGEVRRYRFAGGILTLLGAYALSENVVGGIALYDVNPQYPGEEVLVATAGGNFHVLDHTLTNVLWTNADGAPTSDLYYAGVTVAERGNMAPIALLPVAHHGVGTTSVNSGIVRAVNLQSQLTEWIINPSQSIIGTDAIEGSVALLFEQKVPNGTTTGNPGGGTVTVGDPTGGITTGGGLTVVGGDITINTGGTTGIGTVGKPNDNTVTTGGGGTTGTSTSTVPVYHATFASSDAFLYGIDLQLGVEVWHAQLRDSAWDAPVVDRDNIIYVGDAQSNLYAFEGKAPMHGMMFWVDNRIGGGPTDIVKIGIHGQNGLIVGAGTRAYRFR